MRSWTAQLIVDESWAMAARRGGRFDIRTLTIAGALIWLAWVVGHGRRRHRRLGDRRPGRSGSTRPWQPCSWLLWPQLLSPTPRLAALLGAGSPRPVTLTPPGLPIIAAASAALIGLWRR